MQGYKGTFGEDLSGLTWNVENPKPSPSFLRHHEACNELQGLEIGAGHSGLGPERRESLVATNGNTESWGVPAIFMYSRRKLEAE